MTNEAPTDLPQNSPVQGDQREVLHGANDIPPETAYVCFEPITPLIKTPTDGMKLGPARELLEILDAELDTATIAERRGQKVYRSLQRLSQLIGGEYGDRVIYELLQNAHDAQADRPGRVSINLVVNAPDRGELYVANDGAGFRREDLDGIRNIANSTKDIGEGLIGNKGVGFRSVEALTDDPHVYSCRTKGKRQEGFDGYCFRLAKPDEVETRLVMLGKSDIAAAVASTIPRYLAAMPVEDQPDDVRTFARDGFATVVVLPLRSSETVELAIRQIRDLVSSDAPVLLFLDRIATLDVRVKGVTNMKPRKLLTRQVENLSVGCAADASTRFETVTLGPERRRWLMVRRTVPKEKVIDAVQRSVSLEPGLKRWLNWRGEATVSVAVPVEGEGLPRGRLFNFLPMGAGARSPFFGHLDAPFFTAINRERARLELPLNSYLITAAAEICAKAALVLSKSSGILPTRCIVDLIAWHHGELPKLLIGFRATGTPVAKAEVWPTTAGGWAKLGSAQCWPNGNFKVFTPARATKAGAQDILSTSLGAERLAAIEALANILGGSSIASGETMGSWAEIIARRLPGTMQGELWGEFYADLAQAFRGEGLAKLGGREILLNKELRLVPASEDVYVRQDGGRRRRVEGAPLPPSTLARKLIILSDEIKVRPEIVAQFERAGLWRLYDATEILERLPTLFGDKPAVARREAALVWAFNVWRYDSSGARRALEKADLHVFTRSGWGSAKKAAFSQTWTEAGSDLDVYLAEAQTQCTDCKTAAATLLVDVDAWPTAVANRQEWVRFLSDAGVVDGLDIITANAPEGLVWGANLQTTLQHTKDAALDQVWWKNCGFIPINHPYTYYSRGGEAFMLPGQTVVHKLSDEARRRFAILAIRHLQSFGNKHLHFEFFRKDRALKDQDKRTLRTPLSTFLSTASWFPMEGSSGLEFVPLAAAWMITDRRSQPKFVPRAPDDVVGLLTREGPAADLLATEPYTLRFWRNKATAADRLGALAAVCEEVSQHERPYLRRYYDEAWRDMVELGKPLPRGTLLVVEGVAGFSRLASAEPAACLYIRTERTTDSVKLLIDTGAAVLASSAGCPAEPIMRAINAAGGFNAQLAEEADVRLLTDDVSFRTNLADPLLVDVVPWLPEALVLGHEIGARSMEKNAHVGSALERLRRLRLRQSSSIELVSGAGVGKRLQRYLHRDEGCPTLLVEGSFNAEQLSESANLIAPYVHPNLYTFELLLVRLAPRLPSDAKLSAIKPTAAQYAYAVQADISVVQENLAAYRHDDGHKVELLTPLIAYHVGVEVARALALQLSNEVSTRWPSLLAKYFTEEMTHNLMTAIEATEDLAVLRRNLGLDYARFNRILIDLGRSSLASQSELLRLFDLWKDELRPQLRDRLRRHFVHHFDDPIAFAPYANWRSLDFLKFDSSWIETHETLVRQDVLHYAERVFKDMLGEDLGSELPALETLKNTNRKAVILVAQRATLLLQAVALDCLPPAWHDGPAEIAAILDRAGLLDFHVVDEAEIITLLVRVSLWPEGVAQTLELAAHGLRTEDIDREKIRAAEKQMEEKKHRNRVEFAGKEFDSSDGDFATQFANVAHAAFMAGNWQARSSTRLVNLSIQPEFGNGGPRGAGGGGTSRLPPKLPEAVRAAIGLSGELLAYEYLRRKYPDRFSEQCWVSENRTSLFPEPGDLTLGYDFRVNTAQREWLYEVKATPGELCEFELTDKEYRVAISAGADRSQRYRILFVQYAFDPSRCRILELPNPAADSGRSRFRIVGRSSLRMKFQLS